MRNDEDSELVAILEVRLERLGPVLNEEIGTVALARVGQQAPLVLQDAEAALTATTTIEDE